MATKPSNAGSDAKPSPKSKPKKAGNQDKKSASDSKTVKNNDSKAPAGNPENQGGEPKVLLLTPSRRTKTLLYKMPMPMAMAANKKSHFKRLQ